MKKRSDGMARQGDVLLVPIDKIPADAVEIPVNGRVVLKHGEATGHAHAFYGEGSVRLFEAPNKQRYLRVVRTDNLKHEEHTECPVTPGDYQLPDQVEWTDDLEPRVVAD